MKTAKDLVRVERAYLQPVADAAADAADANALGATMDMIAPAFAEARALAAEWSQIVTNQRLTHAGKQDALDALTAKREAARSEHVPALEKKLADVQASVQHTIEAADRGMEPHGTGFVLRNHEPADAIQNQRDSEARAEMRKMPPDVFRAKYVPWVQADHRLARVAEADPLESLVTPQLREWSRQWRVEHSELLPKLKVQQAQLRTLALVLETIRMEFDSATEAANA